ncbi:type IX secretion system periplasmic lipoprotein PorW/SprE [Pelobium manganitolerans]|uniref:type IX secretion system periplasmic lipoprotein PorW/SprE n=1 Tax=Pelobium manganitolerans TaxID=1842495 RepID=UPI003FA343ED
MLKILLKNLYILFFSVLALCFAACKAKKDKPKVKFMKNLTAHYNIYFNAKESLGESQLAIKNAQEDDFSQLLEIFPVPNPAAAANETQNLDEVIKRANIIATEKYESNWVDDAYLLLADAEYLKRDYYNAIEYYSYVSQTFTREKKNKLDAYLGQVKSDLALDLVADADSVMKLAAALNYKYKKAEVAAMQAKLAIVHNDAQTAIAKLKTAVNATKNAYQKIRWRYILAQLQELNGDTESATANYDKVARSNAAFEMAFNANLSKIRISENAEGKDFDKIATLKKLLREDKNRQFKDQIYYQIAKAYQQEGNFKQASQYYTTAAHTAPGTVKQKGLSYLRLAELNFESLKDYSKAQLYYDSTLQFLPKEYPGYNTIATKAKNLQYLAQRLTTIENEREGLRLANLSDEELEQRVDSVYNASLVSNKKVESTGAANYQTQSISDYSASNKNAGTFYFYNDLALSQGLSAFKRRWGNRKLTDNWRVSSDNAVAAVDKGLDPFNGADADATPNMVANRDSIKSQLTRSIPYSDEAKAQSHQKIATALYEIALFYKDVLKDDNEAVEAFRAVIENFPNDRNAANVYYQLYRLASAEHPEQAQIYKQKLLSEFPNSIYAKAIGNPDFGKDRELRLQQAKNDYAKVYKLYQDKKYVETLNEINALKSSYTGLAELEPNFAYLEALAIGHTQKTPAFLTSLNQIVTLYPEDKSITPLATRQISIIQTNRALFDQRNTALLDHDYNSYNYPQPQYSFKQEPEPVLQKTTETAKPANPPAQTQPAVVAQNPAPIVNAPAPDMDDIQGTYNKTAKATEELTKAQPVEPLITNSNTPQPATPTVAEKPAALVFSTNERQRHLIVINISDPKQNIAQPFSKLSRYFYSKFDPSEVKLVIRVVGGTEKFIIISGTFITKEQTEIVLDELKKNMPEIMEGQTTQYQTFIVSEDNLKLLTDKSAVEQYLKSISPTK